MQITVHSAYHGCLNSCSGRAMTAGKRIIDCGRHAGGGRRRRPLGRVPSRCMWRAAWPVPPPGRMVGLAGTSRRAPGARRRAETDVRSIVWPAPAAAPIASAVPRGINDQTAAVLSQCGAGHSAAAPQCKASRCCASLGMDRRFIGIFTELVEIGAGVFPVGPGATNG